MTIMRRWRHHVLPLAVVACLAAIVAAATAAPARASRPAEDRPTAVVVIGARGLHGERNVPFTLASLAPGDEAPLSVVVRNDASQTAQVTYDGIVVRRGTLAPHVLLTVKQGDRVLASGPVDAARLAGAVTALAPRASTRLTVVLSMPRTTGNVAQGRHLDIVLRFSISGGDTGNIATGITTPDALPPTGESLGFFHALVWAALAALGLLLALVAAETLRRRDVRSPIAAEDRPGESTTALDHDTLGGSS